MESKVSKSGTVKIPFKATPAFLSNNLTASESYFCYASNNGDHLCTVFQINTETMPYPKIDEFMLKSEDGVEITDLKYIKTQGSWKLVLTFHNGFKVYNEDAKRLLTFFRVPEKDPKFYKDSNIQHYFGGISSITLKDGLETLCVGNSLGEIIFIENVKENTFSNHVGLTLKNSAPVSVMSSSAINHILYVGDIQGHIHVYQIESSKKVDFINSIDIKNNNNPITALCVYETSSITYLFVGDSLGKIRVYDTLTFTIIVDIAAHFRAITSLEVNSRMNRFISTSEDTYLNVWKVNTDNGINLVLMKSYNSDDKMIVGGKILEKPKFNVMVTQYECDEISVLTALN